MIQPEILYEDAQLIICYKPAGIATQTKKLGQKDMVSILLNHVAQEGTGQPFIGVVHRLDQPVEGVMVFAKTKQAAAKLSAQMKDHSFGKKILCQSTAYGRKKLLRKLPVMPQRERCGTGCSLTGKRINPVWWSSHGRSRRM